MRSLLTVFCRELRRMASRRIYVVACLVLPLFSLVFMATIFGSGRLENLPVGVVDGDNSSASRSVIRQIEATPELSVARYYANETEARKDVQRKVIYGYFVIPSEFASKVGNNQTVTLRYYYHNALLGIGGELHSTFERVLKQLAVQPIVLEAIGRGEDSRTITSFLMPVTEEALPVYNSERNYSVYLSQPFYFVFLQILLLLVTTFALGSESKEATTKEWLQAAQGNMVVAVIGKMLPYTLIFIGMGLMGNLLFLAWMQPGLPVSLWAMNGLMILFILATQALSLFLYSVFPVLALVISAVSMVGSLGATLSGVTFPVAFMDMPVYAVSFLFPIRHFMEAVQTLLYLHGSFADCWINMVSLLLFLLPPLLFLPRLKSVLIRSNDETIV